MKAENTLFRINNIGEHTYISFDIPMGELDEVAFGSLRYNMPSLIMPLQFEEGESFITLRYGVPAGYIKLDELAKPLKIEEVLMIYSGIIEGLEMCEDWYLETESFYFNNNCIYITEDRKRMGLMYRPQKGYGWDLMTLKEVLIALLEKCDESHGGSIQLQLYKYFYKPQFDLGDFKNILRKFKEQTIERPVEKLKVVPKQQPKEVREPAAKAVKELKPVPKPAEPAKAPSLYTAKVKKEEAVEEVRVKKPEMAQEELRPDEIISQIMKTEAIKPEVKAEPKAVVETQVKEEAVQEPAYKAAETLADERERPSYQPSYNRSQLSQEEIEAMVKSIYGAKTEQINGSEAKSSNEPVSAAPNEKSIYESKRPQAASVEKETRPSRGLAFEEERVEKVEKPEPATSFYGKKETKRKGLFENVFANQKQSKVAPSPAAFVPNGPMLKGISSHPRYDLPKVIPLALDKGAFIIGRSSRNGDESGADFEFGGEITPISHLHAQIEKRDGMFYLKDLGSSNGTFLNGEKIEANKPYMIEEGDKIAFAIAFSNNSIEYTFIE